MSAARTLQRLLREDREPTPAELDELRLFPGWGATPELFDPRVSKYAAEREALEEIWTKDEWNAARRTIRNAHFTHPDYVAAMWAAVDRLGVPDTAIVLEPGCGTGNFIGQARPGQHVIGVERDPTTAGIARMLHPEATIRAESFTDTFLDHDGYDLVIGNVPFDDLRPTDPIYNPNELSLHNYFIVKSLRQTKPGGIVAVMTSRWTLDAKAAKTRREIAQYGELLGAVRMPAGAHGEIAGTEAIIDVLVFRRHLGEPEEGDPSWLHTIEFTDKIGDEEVSVPMNAYFFNNPRMVIGDDAIRKGPYGPELTVKAPDVTAATIAPQLSTALTRITKDAVRHSKAWAAHGQIVTDRPAARIVQDAKGMIGRISFSETTGLLEQLGSDGPEPVTVPKNAVRELGQLVRIRDAAVQLLEAEASTVENTPEMADLRTKLNTVYDRYVVEFGPLGRSTTTVRERPGKDPLITRRYPAAIRAFRQDPHFATVAALERYNEDTKEARKATIFTERVVGAVTVVTHVETAEDAIRVSLDRVGYVDVPLVADLLDITEEDVPERLGDLVFLDPNDRTRYVPAAEYLSGNVREKRKQAWELAAVDATFQRHVDALEQVIPDELGPSEIDVKLGASWVPLDDVSAFIEHTLRREVKVIERIDGEFRFKLVMKPTATAEGKWSVKGERASLDAEAVLKRVLNGESLQLRYRDSKDDPYVVDQVGTEALQERAGELHEAFQDWLWSDADRVKVLQERYNDLYNGIVLRSYDGIELSFPGKAATFTPRPHQHAAVARMLSEPATGLFHEVGAGKTAEMVLGVMELRRLGMVQKPAIIVPNQMLEQFTREFKQIYPRAKVLSAGTEDLANIGTKDGRRLFAARAKTGDWDAVILTHSAFGKIGLGEGKKLYAEERLAELRDSLEQKLDSELSDKSMKRLQRALEGQEQKLEKMISELSSDEGIYWEDTGIDYLCIDEAHKFKNLTVISKVADLGKPIGAVRSTDLDMKLWYHREHLQQSRVCTLATATPLPNSMIEMFVMMRYMRPDLLQAAQVYEADDWAKQFTEQVTAVEAKPDGGGFQVKTRTSKFRNVPELLRMWHIPGDVKTQADLGLPVPQLVINSDHKRAPEMVVVPATRAQQEGMEDLIARGEAVRGGSVKPEIDNMLKITANGRALALDARLMDGPSPEFDEVTKLDVVVSKIYRVWAENNNNEYLDEWGEVSPTRGALQIVFSDLGTPAVDGRWDVYHFLRRELVERGIPDSQIRFVHEAGSDKAKAELFQQCRDGRVQVLIGSTEKMGVGTNVQARAIALHHIDAPWRPADVTQREGREIRQGNQNSEVHIFRYATEGSFDSYMWGTLARKAAFIEQVLTGRLDVREVDNSTEMALQFSEMQAIAAGDMRILEVANLRNETQKLARQERAHGRKITAIVVQMQQLSERAMVAEHDLEVMRKVAPKIVDSYGDKFTARVQASHWADAPTFRDRKEFGQALRTNLIRARENIHYFGTYHANHPAPLKLTVTVAGLTWDAQLRWNAHDGGDPLIEFHAGNTHRALKYKMLWSYATEGTEGRLSQGFESRARDVPTEIHEHEQTVSQTRAEIEQLRVLSEEKWPKKDELDEKLATLAHLIGELERESRESSPQIPPPPPPTMTVAPAGPSM